MVGPDGQFAMGQIERCWALTAESTEGDDQNENRRWVIENNMWHLQVLPIMHTVVRCLRVRFGELYTQFRLLTTSADVHNDVFMEWSGLSRDFPRLAGPSWRCSQIFG